MIDRGHDLPLVRQAELLRLSCSSLYYEPRSLINSSRSALISSACVVGIPCGKPG
jgi:hypothetical protein